MAHPSRLLARHALLALLAFSALAPASQAAPPIYRLTIISVAPKVGEVWSAYINDAGQVAGNLQLKSDPKAINGRVYHWTESGGMVIGDNGDPKATSDIVGLDAQGRLAINYSKPGWWYRIAAWNGRERARVIDFGWARSVNARGDIVGFADQQPLIWMADGRIVPITAGFGDNSNPVFINASGVVLGILDSGGRPMPTMWSETGGTQPLPAPPGPRDTDVAAWGINDAGEVVGGIYDDVGGLGYRWNADTGYELLPGVEKCASNGALASNSSGTVVGWCSGYDSTDLPHGTAWIWTAADGLRLAYDAIDPSDPRREKMIFQFASGINSAGVIVGSGWYKQWHVAFMLTPIVSQTSP